MASWLPVNLQLHQQEYNFTNYAGGPLVMYANPFNLSLVIVVHKYLLIQLKL